ncbi:cell wall-active antibiotics response protein LiaF [Mesobacillus maritimus]|uniref:cell wall-active antibiotics response protein LiaF n=1 Tax=Mesobacillus maritimus TaxID=1643336 RepID=UPI00203A553D|nr:cell wall-active antibiotics response protein LiaF [Mesobacillus maritimus]MCM3585516.1 cell wall-active antibiotics response protein LiaF [Mesobacillus maritimus]MCM3669776.1 cell wall-active antibiotics response protein LiaF [Mesobacillus maritimus]
MLNKWSKDSYSWIVLFGILIVLIEITFFNPGLIFSLFVSGVMIYFGRKQFQNTTGKIIFWLGVLTLGSGVIGMVTFRLFLLAILIYFIIQYAQSKKQPEVIRPTIEQPSSKPSGELLIEQSTLFTNKAIGHQKTPHHVYEWDDVNIITGVGDTVIDLSYTVLPKGETVIFIRNIVGNIKVYIPYDTEVSLRHTVLVGSANVLEYQKERSFNQAFAVKTPDYETAEQKVKILTSMMIGDLEVKRV